MTPSDVYFLPVVLSSTHTNRYPAKGRFASFKGFKAHATDARGVCFVGKGNKSDYLVSVGGKDRCVMQVAGSMADSSDSFMLMLIIPSLLAICCRFSFCWV